MIYDTIYEGWFYLYKLETVGYSTNALLEVAEGETLSLIESNTLGMLVKRNGTVGWLKGGREYE